MKIYLTHNENICIMDDVMCHLKLKKERLESSKPNTNIYMAKFIAQESFLCESESFKVGPRIRIEKRLALARNKTMTNMRNESILSRREMWPRSSASTTISKGN